MSFKRGSTVLGAQYYLQCISCVDVLATVARGVSQIVAGILYFESLFLDASYLFTVFFLSFYLALYPGFPYRGCGRLGYNHMEKYWPSSDILGLRC